MLKNIEKMRAKGLTIKKEWLQPELYAFQIPPAILKGLGLRNIGEKASKRRSRTISTAKKGTKSNTIEHTLQSGHND
jgi:hypothetical protein